jgi:glutamine synthetase
MSCNSYLAAATLLAAGLEGIREGLDPGAPHTENMYQYSEAELHGKGIRYLPRTLGEAVEAFEADPFSRQVFGESMFEAFVDFKRQEWTEYHNHVSEWELQRYLKCF